MSVVGYVQDVAVAASALATKINDLYA